MSTEFAENLDYVCRVNELSGFDLDCVASAVMDMCGKCDHESILAMIEQDWLNRNGDIFGKGIHEIIKNILAHTERHHDCKTVFERLCISDIESYTRSIESDSPYGMILLDEEPEYDEEGILIVKDIGMFQADTRFIGEEFLDTLRHIPKNAVLEKTRISSFTYAEIVDTKRSYGHLINVANKMEIEYRRRVITALDTLGIVPHLQENGLIVPRDYVNPRVAN